MQYASSTILPTMLVLLLVITLMPVECRIPKSSVMTPGDRIAIVGAGPAGLTSAYLLQRMGFQDVTVFEKNDRVGGKVHTSVVEGIPVDMGAIIYETGFMTYLAEEFDVALKHAVTSVLIQERPTGPYISTAELAESLGENRLLVEGFQYWPRIEETYAYLNEQPASNFYADASLYEDFSEFARKNNISALADLFRVLYSTCGYGYYDEVPALYVLRPMLRWFSSENLLRYITGESNPSLFIAINGSQEIWDLVADNLTDVRINSPVQKVSRKGSSPRGMVQVEIETNNVMQIENFDHLIIACDLKEAMNFLDTSEEELFIFEKVRHYHYITQAVNITIPQFANDSPDIVNKWLTLFYNTFKNRRGHTMGVVSKNNSPLWVSYQIQNTPENDTLMETQAILEGDLESQNLTADILLQAPWSNYFPHFVTKDLREGIYSRLETLQGSKSTFYVGGIMNFETVKDVTEFVVDLVQNVTGREFNY